MAGENLTGLAAGLFAGWQMYNTQKDREGQEEERVFQRERQVKSDDMAERSFGLQEQNFGLQKDQFKNTVAQQGYDNDRADKTLAESVRSNQANESFKLKEHADMLPIRQATAAAQRAAADASRANAGVMNDYRNAQAEEKRGKVANAKKAQELIKLATKVRGTEDIFNDDVRESVYILSKTADPTAGGIPHRPVKNTDFINAAKGRYGASIRKNVGNPVGPVHADLMKMGVTPDSILESVEPVGMKATKNGKGILEVKVSIMTPNGRITTTEPITHLRSFAEDDKVRELDLEDEASRLPALLALREELEGQGITADNRAMVMQELGALALSLDPTQEKALEAMGISVNTANAMTQRVAKYLAADMDPNEAYQRAAQELAAEAQGTQPGVLGNIPGQNGDIPGIDGAATTDSQHPADIQAILNSLGK